MSKGKKFIIGCCIAVGVGIFFCVSGFMMGGRVYGISIGSEGLIVNTPQEANGRVSYNSGNDKLDEFQSLDIAMDYTDIMIKPSDHYGIEYIVNNRTNFTYEVKDGRLIIKGTYDDIYTGVNFTMFGFGHSGGTYQREYVTVYVPEGALCNMGGTVKIVSETGNVDCSYLYADTFSLRADYGNVNLVSVGSADATIEMGSGNLDMEWFEDGNLSIKCDYGNVNLDEIKAADMKIDMESGNINMEAVKGKSLELFSDYGSISLRDAEFTGNTSFEAESGEIQLKAFIAGNVDVTSDYGDVKLELMDALDNYAYDLFTDYGGITIGSKDMGESYQSLDGSQSTKKIRVECQSGEIDIRQK